MDFSEQIIQLVREREVIWNLNHRKYKNVMTKAKEWQAISNELRLPVESVKKKWRSLRDNYARNLAKKKSSGEVADDDMVVTGKYSNQMEFLREHLKPRSSTGSIAEGEGPVPISIVEAKVYKEEMFFSAGFRSSFDYLGEPTWSAPSSTLGEPCSTPSEPSSTPGEPSTPKQHSKSPSQPPSTPSSTSSTRRKRKGSIDPKASSKVRQFFVEPHPPQPSIVESKLLSSSEDELFCRSLAQKLSTFPIQLRNDTKLEMLRYVNAIEVEWLTNSCKVPTLNDRDEKQNVIPR